MDIFTSASRSLSVCPVCRKVSRLCVCVEYICLCCLCLLTCTHVCKYVSTYGHACLLPRLMQNVFLDCCPLSWVSLPQGTPSLYLLSNCRWLPHFSDLSVDSGHPNASPQTCTVSTFSTERLPSPRVRFPPHQANGLWSRFLTHAVVRLCALDLEQVTMVCSHVLLTQPGNASSSDFVLGYASWSNKPTELHCCQATLTHGISEDMWPFVKILNWQICR